MASSSISATEKSKTSIKVHHYQCRRVKIHQMTTKMNSLSISTEKKKEKVSAKKAKTRGAREKNTRHIIFCQILLFYFCMGKKEWEESVKQNWRFLLSKVSTDICHGPFLFWWQFRDSTDRKVSFSRVTWRYLVSELNNFFVKRSHHHPRTTHLKYKLRQNKYIKT